MAGDLRYYKQIIHPQITLGPGDLSLTLVEAEGKRVVRQFHAQTEEIAEAVCSAVIGVVRQDRDATPMRRR